MFEIWKWKRRIVVSTICSLNNLTNLFLFFFISKRRSSVWARRSRSRLASNSAHLILDCVLPARARIYFSLLCYFFMSAITLCRVTFSAIGIVCLRFTVSQYYCTSSSISDLNYLINWTKSESLAQSRREKTCRYAARSVVSQDLASCARSDGTNACMLVHAIYT